ncbi:hypothetical protein BO71DRAFT_380837 [Aspergillus ellipticus CBS 707.79]|uniref:Uncharacterized protein n=1 Tax=Aspergillus ellipticus CBS 707.79 TaxID=1448320 RepID=A0A319D8I5_9EURO|nr:hypothetical protein BO71DRAFT_380837 [Aspergillus ellipticus CBS 707.79]
MAFFLICPRFRRYRKSSDSPGTGHAYQLNAAKPSPEGNPEGHFSSWEDASRSRHHRGSSGGLSDKLRRRFSREAKDPYGKPKRMQGKSGVSGLPFKGVITPDDIGSSLMSERGYDSDAQFISTPQPASYTREHSKTPRIAQEATSPLRQPLWEKGQESPYEQDDDSLMEDEAMVNPRCMGYTVMGELKTAMSSPDQRSWATRSSQGSSAFNGTDDGRHRARAARPLRGPGGSPVQGRVRNGPVYSPQQGYRAPLRRPTPDSFLVSPTHGPEHANHLSPVPFSYTTSAESTTGPASQISIKKRRQQPPVGSPSDGCSVHLGDMNIPTALGSHSPSPRVLSPKQSLDENRWAHNTGTWSAYSSGSTTGRAHITHATGPRFKGVPMNQASSCYSPKTSFSSTDGPNNYVDTRFQGQVTSRQVTREPSPCFHSPQSQEPSLLNWHGPGAAEICNSDKAEVQKSKFTERFESNRSLASHEHGHQTDTSMDPACPRKVSVGWMSGGRRLGYGYTLVPANEGADHPSQGGPDYIKGNSFGTKSVATEPQETPRHTEATKGHAKKMSDKTGEPGLDVSSIMNRMHLRSLSSALSDVASGDFRKGSLLEKLSKRKKDQSDMTADGGTKNPWDFCAWVDPNISLSEQQIPQKSASVSPQSTEDRSLGRWATLRRTGTLLTKGRSVSAIARGIEAKANAKFASPVKRYPVARRRDGQTMKFKVLDRNNRALSVDDAVPIVPVEHSDGSPGSAGYQDEEQVDEAPVIQADNDRAEENPRNPSENNCLGVIADDCENTYQECQEILPVK